MFRRGHTILEVVISIGILAVATVSVGSLIDSLRTTDRATTNKAQASALAQQGLEIATAIAQQEFIQTKPCGSYNPPSGYEKCWTECPISVPSCTPTTVFRVTKPSSTWTFGAGVENNIGTPPIFSREITISSIDGTIDAADQVKQLTAKVSWTEKNRNREAVISTIVSAWQD